MAQESFRRRSDHGAVMRSIDEENADVNQTRRQTIGVGTKSKALMTRTTPASQSQSKKTPSKTRVNLGSAIILLQAHA
jgi:hypothetical protein